MDLYRLPKSAREDLISIFKSDKFKDRIWIGFQVILEFLNNRFEAISDQKNKFNAEVSVNGNLKHSSYASVYGEKPVSDYVLLNANLGYKFDFGHSKIFTKLGVENLLDRNYTTYADWNRIPRPGRNFFVNINYNF